MNLLQSFMGCMYPGSIRTESIESMDHDYPDCRFQVSNIDERENEVSRGELQLTDRDLIYFSSSKFPTRWPLDSIRRYGCSDQGNKFIFEAGRRCPTGEAIFAFRLNHGTQLVERLREKIEKFPKTNNAINNSVDHHHHQPSNNQPNDDDNSRSADPRPLSYAQIDFDTTKALNESAQAHAANRYPLLFASIMPLVIHKSWDLLRNKLCEVDHKQIGKRIGMDKTVVFEIEYLKYNPKIPIIDDNAIERWLTSRQNQSSSPALPPPPKQLKTTIKLTGPSGPKASCSGSNSTSGAKVTSTTTTTPSTSTTDNTITANAPTTSTTTSSKTKIKKKSRPKSKRPQREPSPTPPPSPSPSPPPAVNSSKAQTIPSQDDFFLNLSEDDESCASNKTEDSGRTSNAVCVGSIDALVLNEVIDDEYAKYGDDDEEMTEMSKNLKKIRTPKPPAPAPPPPPPRPTVTSNNQCESDSPPSPPPRPKTPPKPLEPDWPETQKQLQQNQFINVYKDFNYFKSHLDSDTVARSLLKEATMKCLQEDETCVLLDLLGLIYEGNFNDDIKFWSEIVQRLKRKLNSHTQIKTYKSRSNPEFIYESYKRAIVSISNYANTVNQTFELPFHVMKFIIDPLNDGDQATNPNQVIPPTSLPIFTDPVTTSPIINVPIVTTPIQTTPIQTTPITTTPVTKTPVTSAPVFSTPVNKTQVTSTTVESGDKVKCSESSSGPFKLEPLPPIMKFNLLLPDIKPEIKIETQENVDPDVERKVTLIKNAQGQTCFKIHRRKSSKTPLFNHRLL